LKKTSTKQFYEAGTSIIEEGQPLVYLFLILDSLVEMHIVGQSYELKRGDIIPLLTLAINETSSRVVCKAMTDIHVQALDPYVMKSLKEQYQYFEDQILLDSLLFLRDLAPNRYEASYLSSCHATKRLLIDAQILRLKQSDRIKLKKGGFIFQGTLKKGEKKYSDLCVIPPSEKFFHVESDTVLVKFNEPQENSFSHVGSAALGSGSLRESSISIG